MKSSSVLFIVLLTLFACQRRETAEQSSGYFDLPAYMRSELKRQADLQPEVAIRWEKDGQVEQKTSREINWEKAFAALEKLDLNRSAYRGSYLVDTQTVGERKIIHYRAKENNMKPRELKVETVRGELRKLEVEVIDQNFLYEAYTYYSYVPDDTLSISGTQQIILGKKHSYKRSYWY